MLDPETIIDAAIQFECGTLFTGRSHAEVIRLMKEWGFSAKKCPQGFVTSTGRFVDRAEAGRIAIAAGQIKKLKYHKTDLFSEELP